MEAILGFYGMVFFFLIYLALLCNFASKPNGWVLLLLLALVLIGVIAKNVILKRIAGVILIILGIGMICTPILFFFGIPLVGIGLSQLVWQKDPYQSKR